MHTRFRTASCSGKRVPNTCVYIILCPHGIFRIASCSETGVPNSPGSGRGNCGHGGSGRGSERHKLWPRRFGPRKREFGPRPEIAWRLGGAARDCMAPRTIQSEAILTGMYSHSGRKLPSPQHVLSETKNLFTIVSRLTTLTSVTKKTTVGN